MGFLGGEGDIHFLQYGGNRPKNHRDAIHHHHLSGAVAQTTVLFMVIIGLICLILNQSDYAIQLVQRSRSPHKDSKLKNLPISRENFLSSHELKSEDQTPQENHDENNLENGKSEPLTPQENHDENNLENRKSEDLTPQENHDENNLENRKSEDLTPQENHDENNFENILKRAAMKDNKTVIITTLNKAWTEPNSIFDLFLESFSVGIQTQSLRKHVVVMALDQTAYSRCIEVHPHCFAVTTAGINFSGEAMFLSKDYMNIMWRRIEILRSVLEMGYNFIFTDADVLWLRNPFLSFYPDGDVQFATDRYRLYNYSDLRNPANAGFVYVKSNDRTIQLYRFWYKKRVDFPNKHDQDVFNAIKNDTFVKKLGLGFRFLHTDIFTGFCVPIGKIDKVVTMHGNCCFTLRDKIRDLTLVIKEWKKYVAKDDGQKIKAWDGSWKCGWNPKKKFTG